MEKAPKLVVINPDALAFKPNRIGVVMEFLPREFDTSKLCVEDGFMFSYSDEEIRFLGEGYLEKGFERLREAICTDKRSLLEMAIDPNRPLQEELEGVTPLLAEGYNKILVTLSQINYSQ